MLTVIATNNGWDYIDECLRRQFESGHTPVAVVDTCSSDLKYREHVQSLCKKYGFFFFQLPEPRYDLGAYMFAVASFPFVHKFWFQHDSLYLKDPKFYQIVEKELDKYDMVGWHFFAKWGSSFDNEEQRQWLVEHFGSDDYDYGFYGPNLAMTRKVADKLTPELQIVDNKLKQQAMERGWAILAKKHQMKVMFLENYKGDVQSEAYRFFRKAQHKTGIPRQ